MAKLPKDGVNGPVNRPKFTAEVLGGPMPTTIDAANVVLNYAEELLLRDREDRRVRQGKPPGEMPTLKIDPLVLFQAASLYHAYDVIVAIIGHEPQVRSLIKSRTDAELAANLAKRAKAREDAR